MGDTRKRRSRDPEGTRGIILEAACTLLSKYGPEAISLSAVAHLAGVNRGTAYQHFETREKLIQATADWVSERLFREVFGDPATIHERQGAFVDTADLTDRLSAFAMQNPELCRIWLLQLLSSPDPESDPFWREYVGSLQRFTATDMAEPGVDSEVLSVIMLAGAFLWPVWARSHAKDDEEREGLAQRFARECLRLSLYGSMRAAKFPAIADRLAQDTAE
ncbi:MAG: TetR/AcrR family transcriptional regulator [Sphingobium sp.]